ncbi:MAG: hypothetical protein JWR32_3373 [Mycobacterium sp.]|jgi:hypothetical protein|nr:hypothetical protein [Mycobacterium sp.]
MVGSRAGRQPTMNTACGSKATHAASTNQHPESPVHVGHCKIGSSARLLRAGLFCAESLLHAVIWQHMGGGYDFGPTGSIGRATSDLN